MVLVPALIVSSLLVVLLVPSLSLQMSLNNPDWSWDFHNPGNYTYIDEDFILYNRPFVNVSEFEVDERGQIINELSEKGLLNRFHLRANETAIWQDCILHTRGAPLNDLATLGYTLHFIETGVRNPETGQMQYSNDTNIGLELASEIVLSGSANLTLINVTVTDYVTIRLFDNASLTMINCTNMGYRWHMDPNEHTEWPSGSPGPGMYRCVTGAVEVADNATVLIEGSTIGKLTGTQYSPIGGMKPGYCDAVTIINSSLHEVRVQSRIPPRIIDSAIYELYANEDEVELRGTTDVTYWLPFLTHSIWHDQDRGPDVAYRMRASVSKRQYKLGEPIKITIQFENLGHKPISLYFNGSDHIFLKIYWLNQSSTYDDGVTHVGTGDQFLYRYNPANPIVPIPSVIAPGKAAEWTVIWRQEPPVPPGQYVIDCWFHSDTLIHAWTKAGFPDVVIIDEAMNGSK